MIYNLDGLFGIGFSVTQALRTLMGEIIALIFSLIEYLYSVFIYLSKAEILDNEFIQSIYSKVGMILGIFMVFKLVFSLIQSLVDPNKFTDKKTGFTSIIWRCVISIVLLGVTPAIFREAFKLQDLIVGGNNGDNFIYKLVAGESTVGSLDNMGRVISSDLYLTFFTDNEKPNLNNGVNDEVIYTDSNSDDAKYYDRFAEDDYKNLARRLRASEINFYETVPYLSIKNEVSNKYIIEFNWLMLLLVGCFTVWMLAMYCVQVAVRVVQLAYLQLIAPVPILSYISNPEGAFKKWINQCVSTYLDLFLRLAIIYFVITMIGDVLNQFTKMGGIIFESTGISGSDWITLGIVKIFIIIGLFLFAHKVPQLLKDLFPSLGGTGKFSFGLNPKKEVVDPLKQMYKSTPLGWAPRALGFAGRKTIGAIDRKVNNLPKPRNKVQQYFDKLVPGYAENAKYREEKRKYDNSMKQGENFAKRMSDLGIDDLNGETLINDFTRLGFSEAYANAYKNESIASDNVNKIKKALAEAQTRGDSEAVGRLTSDLGSAERAHTKAKEALDYQAGQHKKDAEMMSSYKLYKSRTKTVNSWQDTPTPQPAPQISSQQSSVSPQIIVPDTVNSGNLSLNEMDRRQQAREAVQQEVANTNTVVTDRINNATNLSETQRATAESLQQELANLISYKEQSRDQKDRAAIDRDIQKVQAELDKLLK